MLYILFDKNVPYPLKQYLADCQVKTAEDEGWDRIRSKIWPGVELRMPQITAALKRAVPGSFEFIEIPHIPKPRRMATQILQSEGM